MINKKLYYWVSEISSKSGEGRLAFFFIDHLKKKYVPIRICRQKSRYKFINKLLNQKYISPFVGVIYCWIFFLRGKSVSFINYLPLWNFLIFLLLPPSSIIGPITGGAKFKIKNNYFRLVIFPIFYKISELIISLRNFEIIFSTDLLKKYLSKNTIKNSSFNYVISNFRISTNIKKKNDDFLIYYRKHKNKENFFPIDKIKYLVSKGYKINIIGNRLNLPKVKNHGLLSRKKVERLQKKSKFTLYSGENLYSIFILECISKNMYVLTDKSEKKNVNHFIRNFIFTDFKKNFSNRILKKIK